MRRTFKRFTKHCLIPSVLP